MKLFMFHVTAKNLLHRHRLTHLDSKANVDDTNTQTRWSTRLQIENKKEKTLCRVRRQAMV